MRIITVVGIRKSGKTSTVTALVEEIRRCGRTVGTCKSVFCPTFSIDKPQSNTARHLRAGAALVCARAKHETTYIHPQQEPLTGVLRAFEGLDYVLLEGDYLAPVARLVAAHGEQDALQRTNALTLVYVGRVSAREDAALPHPRINALTDAGALLDLIDAQVADGGISLALDEPLPPVSGVTDDGFCQCGCHHAQKQQAETTSASCDGRALRMTPEREALLRRWAQENGHGA